MTDLDRLLELADKATPLNMEGLIGQITVYPGPTLDFIAAASPDVVRELIERVKEAEGRLVLNALAAQRGRRREDHHPQKEGTQSLEARLRAAEVALSDIASWDEEKGHDGHHHGPCMGCQRVFTVRKALDTVKK